MTSHRRSPRRLPAHTVHACGDVELDVDTRMVHVAGRRAMLTFSEFEVLLRMIEDPGRVLTREVLRVFPSGTLRAVDIQVMRLRQKLAGAERFSIETVRNLGYRCCDPSK